MTANPCLRWLPDNSATAKHRSHARWHSIHDSHPAPCGTVSLHLAYPGLRRPRSHSQGHPIELSSSRSHSPGFAQSCGSRAPATHAPAPAGPCPNFLKLPARAVHQKTRRTPRTPTSRTGTRPSGEPRFCEKSQGRCQRRPQSRSRRGRGARSPRSFFGTPNKARRPGRPGAVPRFEQAAHWPRFRPPSRCLHAASAESGRSATQASRYGPKHRPPESSSKSESRHPSAGCETAPQSNRWTAQARSDPRPRRWWPRRACRSRRACPLLTLASPARNGSRLELLPPPGLYRCA